MGHTKRRHYKDHDLTEQEKKRILYWLTNSDYLQDVASVARKLGYPDYVVRQIWDEHRKTHVSS